MLRQPELHNERSGRLSAAAYAIILCTAACAAVGAFFLAGIAALVVWVPLVVIAVVAFVGFLLMAPRKHWGLVSRWFERQGDIAAEAVAHVSTRGTLIAERHATRDGQGLLLTVVPGRKVEGKRQPALLSLDLPAHATLLAGSRAGKARSILAANTARWPGSVAAYDPSGDLYGITHAHRRTLGKVVVLDPFGCTDAEPGALNPFDALAPDTDPFVIDKVRLISESLVEQSGDQTYWVDAAREILTGACLHVLTAAPREARNLYTVRTLICEAPEALASHMQTNEAMNGLVRRMGEEMESRDARELASAMQTARVATAWLDNPSMIDLVCRSSFALDALKRQVMSLYLVLPAGRGASYAKWLRMMVNLTFEALQDLEIPKPSDDVLLVLDEMPLMGKLDRVLSAAGESAKFGVKMIFVAQSVSQLEAIYGPTWEGQLVGNSSLLIAFGNFDLASQAYVSQRIGKGWFEKITFGSSKDGGNTSRSTELQDIARPEEIGRHASRDANLAYFFVAGQKPWLLPRANWDQWSLFTPPSGPRRV